MRFLGSVGIAAWICVIVGCNTSGGPTKVVVGNLSGTVRLNGNPVTGGDLAFFSAKLERVGGAKIKPDGTYEALSLPLGEAIITVDTKSVERLLSSTNVVSAPALDPAKKGISAPPQQDLKAYKYMPIPAKYSDSKATPLKVVVKEGKQEGVDLKLE